MNYNSSMWKHGPLTPNYIRKLCTVILQSAMHHSGYYNPVSLIFGTTIPTSFNILMKCLYILWGQCPHAFKGLGASAPIATILPPPMTCVLVTLGLEHSCPYRMPLKRNLDITNNCYDLLTNILTGPMGVPSKGVRV